MIAMAMAKIIALVKPPPDPVIMRGAISDERLAELLTLAEDALIAELEWDDMLPTPTMTTLEAEAIFRELHTYRYKNRR